MPPRVHSFHYLTVGLNAYVAVRILRSIIKFGFVHLVLVANANVNSIYGVNGQF